MNSAEQSPTVPQHRLDIAARTLQIRAVEPRFRALTDTAKIAYVVGLYIADDDGHITQDQLAEALENLDLVLPALVQLGEAGLL